MAEGGEASPRPPHTLETIFPLLPGAYVSLPTSRARNPNAFVNFKPDIPLSGYDNRHESLSQTSIFALTEQHMLQRMSR